MKGYYTTLLNQVDKEKIRNDSYKFPNTTQMSEQLDKAYPEKGLNFFRIKKNTLYKPFCDFTHSGSQQFVRRFNDKYELQSNYEEELILRILRELEAFIAQYIYMLLENNGYYDDLKKDIYDFLMGIDYYNNFLTKQSL
jgi:hypothetical protein